MARALAVVGVLLAASTIRSTHVVPDDRFGAARFLLSRPLAHEGAVSPLNDPGVVQSLPFPLNITVVLRLLFDIILLFVSHGGSS